MTLVALLSVFCGVLAWVSLDSRQAIREQLLSRDSHVLAILLQNRLRLTERELLDFDLFSLSDEDVWYSIVETADAQGVVAVQLYSASGAPLFSSSQSLKQEPLGEERASALRNGQALNHYWERVALEDFLTAPADSGAGTVSLVEALLPLVSDLDGSFLGIARYLIEGRSIGQEFAQLDRQILLQAGTAAGVGCVLICSLLAFAWRRIEGANAAVRLQAGRLERANAELALFARSSAVGSITAHLLHGLKNPLAGLGQLARAGGEAPLDREELLFAGEAAQRMQKMIQATVEVLQDASLGSGFVLSSQELRSELSGKLAAGVRPARVALRLWSEEVAGEIESYRGGIALMIIANLVQNACDAMGDGEGEVVVSLERRGGSFVFRVSDDGPGIPEAQRERLFVPQASSKANGAGIGLALSRQLASHLSGSLELVESSSAGSVFELVAPLEVSDRIDL